MAVLSRLFGLALLMLTIQPFSFAQTETPLELLEQEQRKLIGKLTGTVPFSKNDYYLKSRDTPRNRKRARTLLKNLISELGLEPKEFAYQRANIHPLIDLFFAPFTGKNVYTTLPSTSPSDEYVVLGAHFDTELYCPGAVDNGSGVTLIYSVVKKLMELEVRTKNVILVFFDQEEEELCGSNAFALYLKKEQINVHSVHSFDMIGWDGDGNREIELELPSPELETIYKDVAKKMGVPVYVTKIHSTDHYSFYLQGFSSIGISEAYGKGDYSPYKDTPADTIDKIHFDFLAYATVYATEVIQSIIQN